MNNANILGLSQAMMAYTAMLVQAQTVIAYRILGMSGMLVSSPGENTRMVAEKGPAFAEANWAAWQAALRGAPADAIANAWIKPIGKRTSSNARRLSKSR